jgi:DNA invertase Pin-like site-specific DNA recombinase
MRERDAAAHRAATVAGLARARAAGKKLGRPRVVPEEAIRRALAEPGRPGMRVIAKRFGVSVATVRRILRGA